MSLSCRSSSMPLKPILFEAVSHWSHADVIVKPFLFDAIQCHFVWSCFSSMPFCLKPFLFEAMLFEAVPMLLGSRFYLMPYLFYAVPLWSRFFLKQWYLAVKIIRWDRFRQLHCMLFEVLRLQRGSPGQFESIHCMRSVDRVSRYSVVSHTGCWDTKRSTSGYVFIMSGGPVTWSSKRQAMVALSTVEAKYVAMSRCDQQMKRMQSWLDEVDIGHDIPGIIKGDSRGGFALTKNTKDHGKIKHIDIHHHYICDLVHWEGSFCQQPCRPFYQAAFPRPPSQIPQHAQHRIDSQASYIYGGVLKDTHMNPLRISYYYFFYFFFYFHVTPVSVSYCWYPRLVLVTGL